MSSLPQTATQPSPPPLAQAPGRARMRLGALPGLARHAGFVVVVALSAVLNTYKLSQNGYSNIFYSAGVKSMLQSLHNFVFVSFDPSGLISVDKPPLALWVQAASAKVFGFSPLALLLPEAIFGVLTVIVVYVMLARRLGPVAAFVGAFGVAVFPSFVAVSRDNGVDPLLILLMTLACATGLRAVESGRWRSLLASAVLVGLAFNVKTLAAYLVVPGIAAGFALYAPRPIAERAYKLAVAGAVMVAVSFAWIAFVELTPASKRPYVGSSTDNTQLGLTFEYNGFGRVEGQVGGPHDVHVHPGARVPAPHQHSKTTHHAHLTHAAAVRARREAAAHAAAVAAATSTFLPNGRYRNPIPFGSRPSPVRLWGKGLGDQDGWTIPLALFGTFAMALLAFGVRRRRTAGAHEAPDEEDRAPRQPLLAIAFVLGGWFLVEAVLLSASKGIVHPYYVSALAPATGAMTGAGMLAIARLRAAGAAPEGRGRSVAAILLAAFAILGTAAVQIVLLHREHYLLWLVPVLIAAAALTVGLLAVMRSLTVPSLAAALAVLMIAPTAYATTTWLAPVEGTFPAAGPKSATGTGGYGVSGKTVAIDRALMRYVLRHHPGRRWALLTVAADQAAPLILMGLDAGALGGYSGTDPAVDGARLAGMVARREARYVLLGGEYSTRGGNAGTGAVLRACRQLTPAQWSSPEAYPNGLTLFDCAGREALLARA